MRDLTLVQLNACSEDKQIVIVSCMLLKYVLCNCCGMDQFPISLVIVKLPIKCNKSSCIIINVSHLLARFVREVKTFCNFY